MAVRWSADFYVAMEQKDLQANAMAVDNTGTHVLLAGRRYIAIKNLDETNVDNIRKFPRQSKYEVSAAEWNPTYHQQELCVISSSQRLEVFTWRLGELTQMHSLRAHTRVITDLNWHQSNPNLLASCSADTFIHIWDMRDSRRPVVSLSAIAEASQVRWNHISSNLLATAHDGDIKLWDQRKGSAPIQYIAAHLAKIHGLDWSQQSETQLATSSQDSTIKFFDTNNPRKPEFVLTTNAPVWRARYTPFGNGLVTVVVPQLRRGENSLLLWNVTSRATPVHTFVGHRDVVLEFEWRKQRSTETDFHLVTWSKDQTLLVWRIEPFLQKLCGHDPDNIGNTEMIETNTIDTTSEKKAVSRAQPLQQEFSLLNVQIPNLEVLKMDSNHRCCTAVANTNNYSVILNVSFPDSYPNSVPPVFQIEEGSVIDKKIAEKLLEILTTTAQQRVLKNRTCLEPCLRQFVITLEQLVDPSDENRYKQSVYLDSDVLGSFNDSCIPFPRTSGAKFCSVSVLVCFTKQSHFHRGSFKVDSATPRSLSALGNAFNTRQSSEYMTVYSYYLQKQRSRIKHNNRVLQNTVITVYDAAGLFSISKQLAEKYVLGGDATKICDHNALMAESIGRWDLVQAWTLARLIVSRQQEDMVQHPFGKQLMQSLITFYATHSDLQTAAMLCCVFGKGDDENAKKKSVLKYLTSGQLATGKKWLKCGGSPYHTIPPADVVADGWVFPLLRSARSNSLDNMRMEELPQLIGQRPLSTSYEYYKLAYAEILHRWGLLYNRAEVLKYLCTSGEIHRGVEFLTDCQRCKQPAKASNCVSCKQLSLECIVCHISVKGSANSCLVCGHGGHTKHMQQWFEQNKVCPTGCGCRCLLESAGIFNL